MGERASPDAVRAAITDGDLLRLYDYWHSRGAAGKLPSRRDVDPLDLPFLLGNLILVEVERDPLRFRYRLAGSNVTRRIGIDPTGRYVDEHPDAAFRQTILTVYTEVATTARPLAYVRDAYVDGRLRHYDVLVLPLARDGATVDMILAAMKFRA